MSVKSMFFKAKPLTSTRFSDFIRLASAEEKKKLYTRVLRKAADEQVKLVARASAAASACRAR